MKKYYICPNCNPQVENMWGKLAKLNAEEWSDFQANLNKLVGAVNIPQ